MLLAKLDQAFNFFDKQYKNINQIKQINTKKGKEFRKSLKCVTEFQIEFNSQQNRGTIQRTDYTF